MRIITIGREFGSGGRELGKRLADALGVPCYDKEIIHEVASLHGLSPEYVDSISMKDIAFVYPSTIGGSFGATAYYNNSAITALASQQEVIKRLAQRGNCVFVGRGADAVLEEFHPLNIFVYADKDAKRKRCMDRATADESEKEILKQMQRIDKNRAAVRNLLTDKAWGKKETYHLCVNTTATDIKALVPGIVAFANNWFEGQGV